MTETSEPLRGEVLPALTGELSIAERDRLADLEAVVDAGMQTFIEVGRAMREIRDARLYRGTHATFEEYIGDRWEMGRTHGYRMIEAASVASVVSPTGDIPANEAQARELAPLVRADPEKAVEVWSELRTEYGSRLTARLIRERVRSLAVPAPPTDRLERHPFSALLYDLPNRELVDMADSIRDLGLLQPIVLYMGQILDGWQRYRACAVAGVEPRFTHYDGDDPFGCWFSLNILRKHYTPEELAAVEQAVIEWRLRPLSSGDGEEPAAP